MIDLNRHYAERLDRDDELAPLREQFVIADEDQLYMDGNSLGRLPRKAASRALALIDHEWGEELIGGWNGGWYEAPLRVGDTIGSLIGAAAGQVAVTDSTSVNLYKLVIAALRLRPGRHRIVTDTLNFPSDYYIIQSAIDLLSAGHDLVRAASRDGGVTPDLDELVRSIDSDTALIVLSHVAFRSGYLYDMQRITQAAHAEGALVIWDLSHSVGAVPIALDGCEADFAVGCTYKYLNGGPGAPAFLYVHRTLQEAAASPIWGWFGREAPFSFDPNYAPATGIARFLAGTPPILSLLTMEAALEPTVHAGIAAIRRKSVSQTEYLIALIDTLLVPLGFELASPRNPAQRGSHVSVNHPEGYRIARALTAELNVIPDFREPNIIRFGCAPLYTKYVDIWETVQRTRQVIVDRLFETYSATRHGVT